MPPEWMWPFDEELNSWFEEISRKRDRENGSETVDMEQNELSDRFRR